MKYNKTVIDHTSICILDDYDACIMRWKWCWITSNKFTQAMMIDADGDQAVACRQTNFIIGIRELLAWCVCAIVCADRRQHLHYQNNTIKLNASKNVRRLDGEDGWPLFGQLVVMLLQWDQRRWTKQTFTQLGERLRKNRMHDKWSNGVTTYQKISICYEYGSQMFICVCDLCGIQCGTSK